MAKEYYTWGKSLSIDLINCSPELIRDPEVLKEYTRTLVDRIDMKAYGELQLIHFGTEDKKGYTGVQLIETSNIIFHCAEDSNCVFIDVFSCKDFDSSIVTEFSAGFFGAESSIQHDECRRFASNSRS